MTTARQSTRGPVATALAAPLLALLLLGALLVGQAGAANAETGGTPPGKAWVRAGHFVPGMGAATIALQPLSGGAQPIMMASGATYGQVSAYQKLAPGSYTATVRTSSTPAGTAPLLSRSFTVGAGEARTIAVLGTSTEPRLALLTDDLTPPKAGTARVRLLSASDAAQMVSVKAAGGPTLAEDTVLGQTTGYTTVPDGTWDLQLQSSAAGSMSQSVELASGSIYTVVALDSGSGVKLDVVTDAAGAMSTPKGAAHTGLGGMAPGHAATTAGAAAGTGSASLLGGGAQTALLLLTTLAGGLLLALTAARRITRPVGRRGVR